MIDSFVNDIKFAFQKGDTVLQLLIINVSVFLIINILDPVLNLFSISGFLENIISFLALPSSFKLILYKPWSIITHMFLHADFMHLLGNMLILYFGGRLFSQYIDKKKILLVYIIGGICGALFFLIAYNFLPFFQERQRFAPTIDFGASAATMAIFIATATYIPNFKVKLFFVIDTRLKYLALLLIFISLINVDKANAGGNIAHIGGAVFGYFFSRNLLKNKTIYPSSSNTIFQKISNLFIRKPKVVYTNYNSKIKNDDLYKSIKKQNQELIDGILDKISKSGYDSLSKEEKDILFKASKN